MIQNFLKIAFRNLARKKGFSIINISGLAIGMASAILILLWVQHELSFDQFHEKKKVLYQAWNRLTFDGKLQSWNTTPKPLAKALKADYPEINNTARVNWANTFLFTIGDKNIMASGSFADPAVLSMFSFPLLKGKKEIALNGTTSLVITESFAKKLFGNEDPMGKVVRVENKDNFTVTGVLKDLPHNTQFNFEYLLPWEYMKSLGWDDDYWGNNSTSTYVELKPNVSIAAVSDKIKSVTKRHSNNEEQTEVFLHPISKWRLYSSFENGHNVGGRIDLVRLFAIIAGFILLIACINFMNLSTARSERRAKEVGIRKVVGAERKYIISQFLGESILIATIAGILALLIVHFSLPGFNTLTDKQLYLPVSKPGFWLSGFTFIIFTGLLAGSYPAIYLSSFQPVKVLKGTFKAANALISPRKVLVVVQFTFAIILIICTLIVQKQIKFAQERQNGYAKENVIYHFLTGDIEKNYDLIRRELLNSALATSISKTSAPITEGWSNSWGIGWQGKDPTSRIIINRFCADGGMAKTLGIQIIEGRDIDIEKYPTDSTACMLNESAVKIMGFKDPIGQIVNDNSIDWHVVGVFKDFILQSPYRPMEPMVVEGSKGWFNVMHIRLNSTRSTSSTLAAMEKIFKKYNPQYPFDYHFVDEEYQKKFNDEKRIGTLAGLFALLTIFISCLGLFALAAYMAENRIKEIGVRKVLGASVTNITTLLSKDFLKLVSISILIASPIAWWAMESWLADFPYRISIHWSIFVTAAVISIIIASMTVSYQAIKAAIANPVKSLRSE